MLEADQPSAYRRGAQVRIRDEVEERQPGTGLEAQALLAGC
jgi:hypothetical protein